MKNYAIRFSVSLLLIGLAPINLSAAVTDGFDYPIGKPNAAGYAITGWEFLEWTTESVYHPAEDWNGSGGGDTDLGDPVYATANGTVVAAGNYGTGWGNIVLIRHDLPSGGNVWSQYAHLHTIFVNSGTVSRGQQVGTIGKGYNNQYSAHLHFEIRKIDAVANVWVTGLSQSQVQARYHNPSVFINANRPGNLLPPTPQSPGTGSDTSFLVGNLTPTFSWTEATGAARYGLYVSKDPYTEIVYSIASLQGTSHQIPSGELEPNTKYRWNMRSFDSSGQQSGTSSRLYFKTPNAPPPPPSKPTNPSPATGSGNQSINTDISWSNGGGAQSYNVYFGTDSTPDSGEAEGNQSSTTFNLGTLAGDTTYYWRIDAVNSAGTTQGSVWSFTTASTPPPPPSKATSPNPADGSTGQSINADLSWSNGGGATSYNVYFGTDATPDSGESKGNQSNTSFDPGTLTGNTTYYWRIDAVNSAGTTTGTVWSFTTGGSSTKIISLSGNLAFGTVASGSSAQRTLTIANTGNTTLTVSDINYPSGFSGAWSGTIAAGGSKDVTVTFSPNVPGPYGGTVTVNSDRTSGVNTINASGTGGMPSLPDLTIVEPVLISPTSVAPGGTIQVDWTEKNQGTSASTPVHNTKIFLSSSAYGTTHQIGYYGPMIALGANATKSYSGDIAVPVSIPPGEYYVTAFIDSDQQVSEENNNNNIGSSTPAKITVGVTPTKVISLSGNLAFGDVAVGSTVQKTLIISNNGNSTLTVNSVDYPIGFNGAWSGTIAAGGSKNVAVTFSPNVTGSYGGTVTVNSDKTSGANTITASGIGTVTPTKIISLSGDLAFGNVAVGSSAQRTLKISNNGNSTLAVSGIDYPSGFSGTWSGTISAGGSKNVTVTFSPSAATSYNGNVTVNSDKTSGGNAITASGTGTVVPTKILLLSGNLAFGNVVVGSSGQKTLTIANNGSATLTVSGIEYPNGFGGAWSGTIPAGGSKNVTVTFSPNAAGSYGGSITVNSDKTSGGQTIAASGNGATTTTKVISLSGNLTFGNVSVGSSAQRTLTIANTGNSTMTVSDITYPSGFTGDWSSGTIAADDSQNVIVTFSPSAGTAHGGNLTVSSDATSGANTRSVLGTGVLPTVQTPTITPLGGAFNNSVQVTLACSTSDAIIHYTIDGSNPTTDSTSYEGPFTLTTSATVKAKAFKSGHNDSGIASANFSKTDNPFLPAVGNYSGLFYETDEVKNESCGFFKLTVTSRGRFTGRLFLAGSSHSLKGEFNASGESTSTISRRGKSALTCSLDLGSNDGKITGLITGGNWSASALGSRSPFNARKNPASQSGRYTLVIPSNDETAAQPSGNGFGTVTINSAGAIRFSGVLSDGTKVSQSALLSEDGQWPLYVSVYKGNGSLMSWITFADETSSSLEGNLSWIKVGPMPKGMYRDGFTNEIEIVGSAYDPLLNQTWGLDYGEGTARLENGDLEEALSNNVAISTKNTLVTSSGTINKLVLKRTPSSGLLKGSFIHPATGKKAAINGVVLQKQSQARGFFIGTSESGAFSLDEN